VQTQYRLPLEWVLDVSKGDLQCCSVM